jgi:hypothetical protein
MRRKAATALTLLLALPILFTPPAAHAALPNLVVAAEYQEKYDGESFGGWIDADSDGCDTRQEVLITESIKTPNIGNKCSLSGGKWLSPYDGKYHDRTSTLAIDHLVPKAEAWRSGAWKWSNEQRQAYTNDLEDSRVLNAITSALNSSKRDKDLKNWLPEKGKCEYIESWVAIKARYSLTVDEGEMAVIKKYYKSCSIESISLVILPSFKVGGSASASTPDIDTRNLPGVTPGAFCSPNGALGISAKGVIYMCAISSTENRNRWRRN